MTISLVSKKDNLMFINLSFNHIASPSGFYLIWTLLRKDFDLKRPLQGLTLTQELRSCKIWRLHTQNLRINKKAWFNSSKRGLSKKNLIKNVISEKILPTCPKGQLSKKNIQGKVFCLSLITLSLNILNSVDIDLLTLININILILDAKIRKSILYNLYRYYMLLRCNVFLGNFLSEYWPGDILD